MLNNNHFSIHHPTLYEVSFGTLRGVKQCSFYNILLHIVSSTLLRNHTQERVNCKAVSIPDRLFLHRFGFSYIKIKKSFTQLVKTAARVEAPSMHTSPKAPPWKSEPRWARPMVQPELRLPSDGHGSNGTGGGMANPQKRRMSSNKHKALFHD